MDGAWGLQTATDHCSSMQNLEQAPSMSFALNISERSCGFFQAGIADNNCDLQLHALPILAVFVRDPAHPRAGMVGIAMILLSGRY